MLYTVYMNTCTAYEADNYDTESHFMHPIVVRGMGVVYSPFNI